MRAKTTKPKPDPLPINEIDIDEIIKDLKTERENERIRENDINWLQYIFPALRSRAEDICDALGMSRLQKQSILYGKMKSHDDKWNDIKNKTIPVQERHISGNKYDK